MFSKKHIFYMKTKPIIHNYVHCTIEYKTCTCKFMSIDVHPMVLNAHQLLNSGSAWGTKRDEGT